MTEADVTFPLAPVYAKQGITFVQGKAVTLYPEGSPEEPRPHVLVERTEAGRAGERERVSYDYLLNATGPRLNFAATPGLGPEHHSQSVCTFGHATKANEALQESIARMKKGEKQTFLVGTGHGMATCQGAAFEYIFNVEAELRRAGVRDKAELVWLSNEAELGDFGMGGFWMQNDGYVIHSRALAESFYQERGLDWVLGAHVEKVEPGVAHYETLDGEHHSQRFDFAMLIPPFAGAGLTAFDKHGNDITPSMFNPAGFMLVDGDYTPKPYEAWKPSDWPRTYQTPRFSNVFAAGIAFAPPHAISKPRESKNGTKIFPTPPRTGMPSAMIGRATALSIVDLVEGRSTTPTHEAPLSQLGAACVASAGTGFFSGMAASMTVFPIVPDFEKYPEVGRDLNHTSGEVGLAGHWIKHLLHVAFLYKAKARPFWNLIPE
jgi:sulfide:quinone oxidoreductase